LREAVNLGGSGRDGQERGGLLPIGQNPDLEAWALGDWVERFEDQDFSLVDAVSFVVMGDGGSRKL
jgi:predicted nucleic acid-binding protein